MGKKQFSNQTQAVLRMEGEIGESAVICKGRIESDR